jgi:hypothetical protein
MTPMLFEISQKALRVWREISEAAKAAAKSALQ